MLQRAKTLQMSRQTLELKLLLSLRMKYTYGCKCCLLKVEGRWGSPVLLVMHRRTERKREEKAESFGGEIGGSVGHHRVSMSKWQQLMPAIKDAAFNTNYPLLCPNGRWGDQVKSFEFKFFIVY